MAAAKKPAGLLAIFGKPKGSEDGPGEDSDDAGDMESAKMTAAEDAMSAFEAKDVGMLSEALQRHYEACAAAKGEDSEEY